MKLIFLYGKNRRPGQEDGKDALKGLIKPYKNRSENSRN